MSNIINTLKRVVRKQSDIIFRSRGIVNQLDASLNEKKKLQGRFCVNPFSQLDVYEDGNLYSCCSAWLPLPLGKITKAPLAEVWNSAASQKIRKSILDGSFNVCNHQTCPLIQNNSLPTVEQARIDPYYAAIIDQQQLVLEEPPLFINLCNDASCNLSCPSCRTKRILYKEGKEFEQRKTIQQLINEQLFSTPTQRKFRLSVTGSGDPFASTIFRDFLFNLDGSSFPNLGINLQTNGVLLTPGNWRKLHKIHDNIKVVLVSLDAATSETYSIVRRGGHWATLMQNLTNLAELRAQQKLHFLRLDFVVQLSNFREMPDFVQLAKRFNPDEVCFSMVLDWRTWSADEFLEHSIWRRNHPRFAEFMQVMQDPALAEPFVNLGNLSEYRSESKLAVET